MGWASEQLSPLSELFIGHCASLDEEATVLDIGAAFGLASLAALRSGVRVIANDIETAHLDELLARARAQCGKDELARLTLTPAHFPRELHCEAASLAAVHASNVLHFLTGNQLALGFRRIARWLRPGGVLFVQAATPFQAPFVAFMPEFERRIAASEKWPGWIEKISAYSSHRQLSQMPRAIHLLDDRVLRQLACDADLAIERAWLYRRPDLPATLHLDGRESVALIARRPLP